MIKTESLKFSYDGKKYFDFPDINLDSGENLLIIGNSGIGKTTLLHLLAGILKPESGSINISGTDISKFSDTELDKFRGDNIGIVFQKPHFISSLTINENLKLAKYLSPSKTSGDAKKILEEIMRFQDNRGIFPTGYQYKLDILWPDEFSTWTNAAVIIAADCVFGISQKRNVFLA